MHRHLHHSAQHHPLSAVGKLFLILFICGFLLSFSESKIPAIVIGIIAVWFLFT